MANFSLLNKTGLCLPLYLTTDMLIFCPCLINYYNGKMSNNRAHMTPKVRNFSIHASQEISVHCGFKPHTLAVSGELFWIKLSSSSEMMVGLDLPLFFSVYLLK